jgi:hypothetical protein
MPASAIRPIASTSAYIAVAGVDLVVLAQRDLAAAEQVEHADAEQVLLRECVHRGEPHADLAEALAHRTPRDLDEHDHQRQRRERHQRQLDVDAEHDGDDDDRLDRIRDQRDRALREHLVQALDVVRHARHQAPDGDPVEERGALREHVIEDRDAQPVHRALPRELQEPLLEERRDVLRDDEADEDQRVDEQHVRVRREDVVLQRVHHQVRLRELEHDRRAHEHDPRAEQRHVRPDVLPHPPDQPDVVGLAEDLLGFQAGLLRDDRHYTASATTCISLSSCVRYSSAYTPRFAISSAWVPRSTSCP